jgi:hypothetical protein
VGGDGEAMGEGVDVFKCVCGLFGEYVCMHVCVCLCVCICVSVCARG